uniref:Aminopeptidase P family protein n=1 Tax=Schlesneria paludicola TaxID=360056 RepID=A0A7C4QT10_9PLAN
MKRFRFAARRSRLCAAVKKAGLEALLVGHPPNVTYLTGFTGDSSHLLLGPRRALLISDSRFETQLAQECPELPVAIRTARTSQTEFLSQVFNEQGLRRVGFEAEYTSVAQFTALSEKAGHVQLTAQRGLVESLRQIKDPDEIAAIRRAIAMAERGLRSAWARVLPDMTERATAHELEHEMRRFGALRAAFEPILGVGPQSALPHYRAGVHQLRESPFVLIDWGAVEPSGYHSDLTRVLALSKIPPKLEKLHRVVMNARNAALAVMRPGAAGQAVDAAARKVIEDAGFGKYFGHGLGHGIGLEIHEGPRLSPTSQELLQPGMVVTVEPGIYLPGFGGVRLEDDVLITSDGCEVLSTYPLEL